MIMKQNIMNIFRYTIALAALLIMGTASAWAEDNYTITKANTENGSFSVTVGDEAASQAAAGATVTITTTPDNGYEVDGTPIVIVTTNWEKANTRAEIPAEQTISVTAGTANTWTFTMPNDNVTVIVVFKKIDYAITLPTVDGGTISVMKGTQPVTTANMGDEITLGNTPNEGWQFVSYSVKDAAGNDIDVTNGTFIMPIGAVTISATFEKIDYALTIPEGIEHGTVAIAGNNTTAQIGDEVTLITTPDAGYELDAITVTDANGNPITVTNGKFIMPAGAVTISVTFKKIVYTINIDSNITGGTIAASPATATIGDEITLTVTPNEGYNLKTLTVKDAAGNEISVTNGKFTMPAGNVTVSAEFAKTAYTVTISEGITNGKVTVSPLSANMGDEMTLTVTPDAGYELETLTVKDAAGNPITVTNGKFIMPAGAVTISATFKKIVYTITVDSDITGGMVTASATTATIGDEITLTISPSENYVILDVIVKDAAGNSIGTNTVGYQIRTFTMPASNVTVSATFTYVEPTPEPEPTPTPTPTPTPEPEPTPTPTPGPEPGPTGVLVDVEATDAENTNEEVSNVKMQMAVAGETGKEEVTYTDENGNEQTKEMNVVPVMLDKISIPEQQETTQGEEKKELVVSIPAEILSNDGETIFRVTEIGEYAMRSVEETAIVVGVIFPDTPDPIKVAEGALRVDNLPADDPNHRIASVETPLALLDNYALMSSLKENYEGAMVKAVAEPPHRFWTFSSGVDVQLPDGVGVYGCRVKSADEIEIMEIEGNDLLLSDGTKGIKANNAVFVACTNGSDGNAFDMVANPSGKQSGAIPSTENAKSYKDNELLPVIEDMHFAPGEVAILSDNRFHPIAAGDESKVPACKGVMPMTKLASTRSITIVGAGGTTAIKAAFAESLYAGDSKAEWYDLRGNRISRPSKKGIYVLNGKKVMIK